MKKPFKRFNEVVNTKQLKNLEISDLELILNGAQEIDIQDWRSHTEYRGGYFDSHDNIQLFWQFITQLTDGKSVLKFSEISFSFYKKAI